MKFHLGKPKRIRFICLDIEMCENVNIWFEPNSQECKKHRYKANARCAKCAAKANAEKGEVAENQITVP